MKKQSFFFLAVLSACLAGTPLSAQETTELPEKSSALSPEEQARKAEINLKAKKLAEAKKTDLVLEEQAQAVRSVLEDRNLGGL